MTTAHITGVSGGEVLAATYADLDHLAGRCARAGLKAIGWCRLPTETLVDDDLLTSAALAPVSFARVEAALTETLVGADALPAAAAEWEALGLAVLAAREAIELADSGEVQRLWLDAREEIGGAGLDVPLPDRVGLALGGGLGALTTRLAPTGVGLLCDGLSDAYGAETPMRTSRLPLTVASSGLPPRSVSDLAVHLAELSAASDGDHPENDGTLEIQTLLGPDGRRRHVVYLPGTDDMNPFSTDGQLRDMQENVRLVAGQDTDYAAGVLHAMRTAGVRPGEPVLLAGHSQGGMVAAALAAHGSPYDVTNVVTLGSPTAQVGDFPPGVHVLSLEHDGDLVPQLAGVAQPSAEHVTVRFDSGFEGVVGNHSFVHYTAGAAAVDASTDPDVVANRATLAGFLGAGQTAQAQMFQLTRVR